MRRTGFIALLVPIVLIGVSGCLFVDVTMPLDIDLDQTELGDKTGEASSHAVLWAVAWGDAGTKAAAENGDITVVRHADTKLYSFFLGIYTRRTTVVYGD